MVKTLALMDQKSPYEQANVPTYPPQAPSPNAQAVLPQGYQPQIQLPPQEGAQQPPQYIQQYGQPGMQQPSQTYQPQQSAPVTQAPVTQAPVGQTAMYIAPAIFGEHPQPITCMNCKQQGISVTEKTNGAATWIAAGVILFVCCPCAWVPLVIDSCKDTNHRCATCGMVAGTKKMI
ncbi:hypothetical protein HDV01_000495 [Terramyces sp. JEL0728]|nr:hypothetical protein HDV01_000495 [Terramyces sp. JEL0728]